MAFGAIQISPTTFNPSTAIGVNLPLALPRVFDPNYETRLAIRNNITNYFLTNPGERPGNPTFGGGIRKFIFEQISSNTFDNLREDIQAKFSFQFPNVIVQSIEIEEQPDYNILTVKIAYEISNTNISDNLEFTFN
jgi:phage baseplate assembly protein W|tara:strand:+ start:7932 stop:8339 length:408 start_codon:yes stop_codon:yes gene_type:complete